MRTTRSAVVKGAPVRLERVERVIPVLRGQRVILDKDLAILYGVRTRNLNKAVSRHVERFPDDFMLQLSQAELRDLKFHFGTSSWGGTRKRPRAFTEQGVAMLSSVLRALPVSGAGAGLRANLIGVRTSPARSL